MKKIHYPHLKLQDIFHIWRPSPVFWPPEGGKYNSCLKDLMSFPLDHCHMWIPGIIYRIYFCVVHGGASPSCGVFTDYSNTAVEITLRKEHEIKRIYYTYSTHSSTLAWKIPWTEEPGRLQSMGSLGVEHDWAASFSLSTFMHWRRKWQPTPVFFPGESQGQGSLVGCHLWGCTKSDTTEAT